MEPRLPGASTGLHADHSVKSTLSRTTQPTRSRMGQASSKDARRSCAASQTADPRVDRVLHDFHRSHVAPTCYRPRVVIWQLVCVLRVNLYRTSEMTTGGVTESNQRVNSDPFKSSSDLAPLSSGTQKIIPLDKKSSFSIVPTPTTGSIGPSPRMLLNEDAVVPVLAPSLHLLSILAKGRPVPINSYWLNVIESRRR